MLTGGSIDAGGMKLTLTLSEGGPVEVSIPEVLRRTGLNQAAVQALIDAAEADDLDAADVAAQITQVITARRVPAAPAKASDARTYALRVQTDGAVLWVQTGSSGATERHVLSGWSADQAISRAELTESSASNTITMGDANGLNYLVFWRADADGGDPTEVHLAGGGNARNLFGDAVDRAIDGVAGKLIVSVARQNADLLSGELARLV